MSNDKVMLRLEELYKLAIKIEDLWTGLAIVDYAVRYDKQVDCAKGDKK